ncbi:MAG: dodecin family protein [Acidobacteriota bacterium]
MSVVKVTEISSSSPNSFEDAINTGIARASQTLRDITGAWINEQKVVVENGRVTAYRVNMKISFRLEG